MTTTPHAARLFLADGKSRHAGVETAGVSPPVEAPASPSSLWPEWLRRFAVEVPYDDNQQEQTT